ncbi:hypothetical protein PRUPE_1G078000 [Prunus persica]|uniref:Defensin-like protein n=1 Tax=Prunus persica TaxID=3760 RepID=A0A251QU84_PRUPE|nr:hypothetical protein PRUPE_1G078000 [Prunus persica]
MVINNNNKAATLVHVKGVCHPELPPGLCMCSYFCGPPPAAKPSRRSWTKATQKIVHECNTDCCNAKCASQYNDGVGICDHIVGPSVCMCNYDCD